MGFYHADRSRFYSVSGLGQGTPQPPPAPATTPADPLWARLVAAFGTPFASAAASRVAYGQRFAPYPQIGVNYSRFGVAGVPISSEMMLVIVGGLAVVFLVSRK